MHVLAINGSPQKSGNTSRFLDAIIRGAQQNGNSYETVNLRDAKVQGCTSCMGCKRPGHVGECSLRDGFQNIVEKIEKCDCLLIGTPIYMGTLSGQMKCFLDRWYSFLDEKYNNNMVAGKQFVSVVVSGAPAENFCVPTANYFQKWLGDFFKMHEAGRIVVGELGGPKDSETSPQLEVAFKLGQSLCCSLISSDR